MLPHAPEPQRPIPPPLPAGGGVQISLGRLLRSLLRELLDSSTIYQ